MYYLIIRILDLDYRSDIFLALESAGINKASYYKAINLDRNVESELPLLKGFFEECREGECKETILVSALVQEKKEINDFLHILKESGLDIKKKNIIRLVALKADMVF